MKKLEHTIDLFGLIILMQTIDHNPIDEALVQELVSYRDVSKARQRNYAELLKMEIKEKEFSRNKDK